MQSDFFFTLLANQFPYALRITEVGDMDFTSIHCLFCRFVVTVMINLLAATTLEYVYVFLYMLRYFVLWKNIFICMSQHMCLMHKHKNISNVLILNRQCIFYGFCYNHHYIFWYSQIFFDIQNSWADRYAARLIFTLSQNNLI